MKFNFVLILLVFALPPGYSQTSQTPYSSKGLGEVVYPGTINNYGMGGISIAYPSSFNYSIVNPALLSINSLTTFEVGFSGETRRISSDSISQVNGSGNMSYLAICFPVKTGFWTSGFALTPYSYVNYNITSQDYVNGTTDTVKINYKGSGGVNSLSWSNGFLLFKSLAIGARVSYMFGSTIDETLIELYRISAYKTAYYEKNSIQDFSLSLGMDYRIPLSKNLGLNIGAIYERDNNLNVFRTERLDRRRPDNDLTITSDTIIYRQPGTIYLPERIGAGLTLVKSGKWIFGVDYMTQHWSHFSDYYNNNDNLTDSKRYAAGAEFIPDANSVNNYFARVIYRAGVSYNQSQYIIDDKQVIELGIHLGMSLPVGRSSLLNFAMQYGQRGDNAKIAINENYIKLSIGLTYNDRWFVRRRIE